MPVSPSRPTTNTGQVFTPVSSGGYSSSTGGQYNVTPSGQIVSGINVSVQGGGNVRDGGASGMGQPNRMYSGSVSYQSIQRPELSTLYPASSITTPAQLGDAVTKLQTTAGQRINAERQGNIYSRVAQGAVASTNRIVDNANAQNKADLSMINSGLTDLQNRYAQIQQDIANGTATQSQVDAYNQTAQTFNATIEQTNAKIAQRNATAQKAIDHANKMQTMNAKLGYGEVRADKTTGKKVFVPGKAGKVIEQRNYLKTQIANAPFAVQNAYAQETTEKSIRQNEALEPIGFRTVRDTARGIENIVMGAGQTTGRAAGQFLVSNPLMAGNPFKPTMLLSEKQKKELVGEAEKLGGTTAQVGSLFIGGPIGTTRLTQAALTASTSSEVAANIGTGLVFGALVRGSQKGVEVAETVLGQPRAPTQIASAILNKGLPIAMTGQVVLSLPQIYGNQTETNRFVSQMGGFALGTKGFDLAYSQGRQIKIELAGKLGIATERMAERVTSPKSLEMLSKGQKYYPPFENKNVLKNVKEFEKSPYAFETNPITGKATTGYSATEFNIQKNFSIKVASPTEGSGLFVAPETSLPFLRLNKNQGTESMSLFGISDISRPQILAMRVSEFTTIPKKYTGTEYVESKFLGESLKGKIFGSSKPKILKASSFLLGEQKTKPVLSEAYISPMQTVLAKGEAEAIIPAGGKFEQIFKQTGIKGTAAKLFGFEEYTVIEGKRVPIKLYDFKGKENPSIGKAIKQISESDLRSSKKYFFEPMKLGVYSPSAGKGLLESYKPSSLKSGVGYSSKYSLGSSLRSTPRTMSSLTSKGSSKVSYSKNSSVASSLNSIKSSVSDLRSSIGPSRPSSIPSLLSSPRSKISSLPSSLSIPRSRTNYRTGFRYSGGLRTPNQPPTYPSFSSSKKTVGRTEKGFDVLVKEEGTKKYILATKSTSLPKTDALIFGENVTDNSLGASFFLRKSSKPVGSLNNLTGRNYKFRISKRAGYNRVPVYVEKETFRLDTPNEVAKIHAARVSAQLRKNIVRRTPNQTLDFEKLIFGKRKAKR